MREPLGIDESELAVIRTPTCSAARRLARAACPRVATAVREPLGIDESELAGDPDTDVLRSEKARARRVPARRDRGA